MTIKEAQEKIDSWISEYGIRYFNELTNLAVLMEEVGEVAKILARSHGEQSVKVSDEIYHLDDELADILFVLICIANQSGIDLTDALERNIRKKTNRDGRRHLKNAKLKDKYTQKKF